MSAWELATRRLHEIGGGPIQRERLDYDGMLGRDAVNNCRKLGLMECSGRGVKATWTLTDLGEAFAEGRAVAVIDRSTNGKRNAIRIARIVQDAPDDETLGALLLESGHEPGQAVSAPVLREFGRRLVGMVREGVTA